MRQARIRVELQGESGAKCIDFNTGFDSHLPVPPSWMQASIALLNIAGTQVEVRDVGVRWGEQIYYLTIKGDFGEGAADE
jgi:hypothetical protein